MSSYAANSPPAKNAEMTGIRVERSSDAVDRRISVAPMMDWTDRHCRYFLRLFSPRTLLYTEMITAAAIVRGDRARLLHYHPAEHPLALQIGGSDPKQLAVAAIAGEDAGYQEINLNCGCPSDRVSAGAFGACLMARPKLVAECVAAMRAVVKVPVTVKLRVGVVDRANLVGNANEAMVRFDESDFAALAEFAREIVIAGSAAVIVHARKAVLGGFSPHDNRTVPPLRFEVVERLRLTLPDVPVIVNGGVRTCAEALSALDKFSGVMIGREAYHRPWLLAELQEALFPADSWRRPDLQQILAAMSSYAQQECAQGARLNVITRHMLGVVSGQPGAREFRQLLAQGSLQAPSPADLFRAAEAVMAKPLTIGAN
jgi:tRNA-dihydrouridine synthase A